MIFELEGAFIELNKLLKACNLCESGAHASACIDQKLVQVNGAIETRRRNKIYPGFIVEFNGKQIQVIPGTGSD
jgi:ribosome-associated protein